MRVFLYQREADKVPQLFIDAHRLRTDIWLAGRVLELSLVYETSNHPRGYVCIIQEIGCCQVHGGESFGPVHLVDWFADLTQMKQVFDVYKSAMGLHRETNRWSLEN